MENNKADSLKKLNELIKHIRVAMLTTMDDGGLRARPMATQENDIDGDIWFMTSTETHKTEEIEKDSRVNVAYSDSSKNTYISVSGNASVNMDREKIKEFWNPIYKAYFPKGLDDPSICLLKVTVERAEYWDADSSKLVLLADFVKAIATGKQVDAGEHGTVNI